VEIFDILYGDKWRYMIFSMGTHVEELDIFHTDTGGDT
jgi:hypothetical protein